MLTSSVQLRTAQAFGPMVQPTSLSSGWQTLGFVITGTTAVTVGALGADTIAVATSIPFYREQCRGTNLRIRVIYDDDATAVSTALKYRVWARRKPDAASVNEDWQLLPNRTGDVEVTPVFGFTADVVIATDYRATLPDLDDSTHDCDGNDEFFIEITQGMALTGGTDSQARFQVKII